MASLQQMEWRERVAKIKEAIEYSNTYPHDSLKSVAEAVGVSATALQRTFIGDAYTAEFKEVGVALNRCGNKRSPHKRTLLTMNEVGEFVRIINRSWDLGDALANNSYSRERDGVAFDWSVVVITTLWNLKQTKRKLYDRGEE